MQLKRDKHKLQPSCMPCKKNCVQHIPESLRSEINRQYWILSKKEQELFVMNSIEIKCVQRRRGLNDEKKRNWSFFYLMKNPDGVFKYVCKQFYLATLGFTKNNDFFIQKICSSNEKNSSIIVSPSNNSNQEPWNKIDIEPIKCHIPSILQLHIIEENTHL